MTTCEDIFGYRWPHRLLNAHAGTGKTHRLSARFLRLICAGAPASNILASTFTRKAAGEIRERVVLRLARAATGDDRAIEDLRDRVGGLGKETYHRQQAADDLDRLLNQLPTLRITTLDGFLQQCVQVLRGELGLLRWTMGGSEQAPAIEAARLEAIESCLDQMSQDEPGDDLITMLLTLLGIGRVGRSSIALLQRVIHQRHEAYLEQPSQDAWDLGPSPWPLLAEDDLEQSVHILRDASPLLPQTAAGKTNKKLPQCLAKDLERITNQDWSGFLQQNLRVRLPWKRHLLSTRNSGRNM